MAITLNKERQYPLQAVVNLTTANVGASNAVTVNVPPNALVTVLPPRIVTAFNTAGSGTMTVSIGDGTTTFVSAENAKASAGSAVAVDTPNGKFYPAGGTLTFSLAEVLDTTAATAGQIVCPVEIVVLNRCNEIG